MRRFHPRVTVRRLLFLVLIVAVALGVVREFGEGLPPRYVIRSIPGRIARLRPGMTSKQVKEILGVNKSWVWGGIGDCFAGGSTGAWTRHEAYNLRRSKIDPIPHQGGVTRVLRSSESIQLLFRITPGATDWWNDESARLVKATFSGDGRTIAEMPTPRPDP